MYKLEELLKQTEYLVQDLQEELEMKDSLKLKELTHDNCESEYTFSNAFSEKTEDGSSPKHVMDYTVNFNTEELYEHKAVESSESMSRIEAELEAELERLGLNINTQGVERFPDEDEVLVLAFSYMHLNHEFHILESKCTHLLIVSFMDIRVSVYWALLQICCLSK